MSGRISFRFDGAADQQLISRENLWHDSEEQISVEKVRLSGSNGRGHRALEKT
jgi:hypothetical protein